MSENEKRPALIIEDSMQDAELLRQILLKTAHNLEPIPFESAEECFAYLNEAEAGKRKMPSLVLLDLYLPGVGGLDFLKTFHQNPAFKKIPIIVLTGSQERTDLMQSYKLGAAYFMKKPYRFEEILGVLGQLKITGRL